MRLGGLASGMDTDSMVDQLMKAQNMKVERVEAEKQVAEWQKESLNGLNKDFANFILDAKKDLEYNSSGKPGKNDWAKSAVSSDESVGTARAGQGALEGKHTIEDVVLAKGVSGGSVVDIKDNVKEWEETKKAGEKGFKFKLNGEEIEVSKDDSMKDIARKINSSKAGVSASYDENLGRFFISTKGEGTSAKIKFEADEGDENGAQLEKFIDVIGIGITKFDDEGNPLKNDAGDLEYDKLDFVSAKEGLEGTNGSVIYNGLKLDINSNRQTFNGVDFDFKTEGSFTVNVNTDADTIVNKVTKFVEDYNALIEKTGKLINEKQHRDFKPLTDEQREAMSEKEIEKWEKKARSGVIKGDRDVQNTLSSIRSNLYKNFGGSGQFSLITELGITTQKYSSGETGGLLEIDEDKLRDAIAKDSDAVLNTLFGQQEVITNEDGTTTKQTHKGLFDRVFDDLADGMKNIILKSGPGEDAALFRKVKSNIMTDFVTSGGRYSGKGSISDIDDDVLKFDKKIADLKRQLARKEEMYFAQFAAMEKAMQKANSQGDWLMQQTQMM